MANSLAAPITLINYYQNKVSTPKQNEIMVEIHDSKDKTTYTDQTGHFPLPQKTLVTNTLNMADKS